MDSREGVVLEHPLGRHEIEVSFAWKAGHEVAAHSGVGNLLLYRADEIFDILDEVGPLHRGEYPVRRRLHGDVHKAADVGIAGHCRDYVDCDVGRFERAEADAAIWRQRGEGSEKFGESLPARAIEREVAARYDYFVVAGVDEALRLVENGVKVDRRRLAPELRDYAKGACASTPVLDFQVGAGRPRGDGNDGCRLVEGAGGVLHGDFRRVADGKAALYQKPL